MKYFLYSGRLGNEHLICELTKENCNGWDKHCDDTLIYSPNKGELISIGSDSGDATVYRINDIMLDYANYDGKGTEPQYLLFVTEYDWE